MDRIAICVGWVAITASRLQTVIGIIVMKLRDAEEWDQAYLGGNWSVIYGDAKKAYRDLEASTDDPASRRAAAEFTKTLHETNRRMTERHHVMHAVWTADPEVTKLDAVSSTFRRTGPDPSRDWTVDRLWQLAQDLNALHQLALAEMARLISR